MEGGSLMCTRLLGTAQIKCERTRSMCASANFWSWRRPEGLSWLRLQGIGQDGIDKGCVDPR
eukprot:729788-Pyramimonas_sp.AAC.1